MQDPYQYRDEDVAEPPRTLAQFCAASARG